MSVYCTPVRSACAALPACTAARLLQPERSTIRQMHAALGVAQASQSAFSAPAALPDMDNPSVDVPDCCQFGRMKSQSQSQSDKTTTSCTGPA